MINYADIHFNQDGTPVADHFDDVYFSNDNGLAESNYVFYNQNNIAERLQHHPRPYFVIAETGFGTGLNFLNAWRNFVSDHSKQVSQLHFISFEKFPLNKDDLASALKVWPELSDFAADLIDAYPINLPGCHRLEFNNGAVILDLWFGDVSDSIHKLSCTEHGIVDAWFLDGFAPSKNPDMWQQSLFDNMAKLAKQSATFATFTAAGFVRRGLIEAGFTVEKCKGFGKKREMIKGVLSNKIMHTNLPPYHPRNPANSIEKVAIIGGGVAAASISAQLAKRNIPHHLFCKDPALAMGASHNLQGAVYPHLQGDFNRGSEFYAHSFYYAKRLYKQLLKQGFNYSGDWCGVLLHGVTEGKREIQQGLANKNVWPKELIHSVSIEQANSISGFELGYDGLFIPDAGWVSPPELVSALYRYSQYIMPSELSFNTEITSLARQGDNWLLITQNGEQLGPFSQVIVACGELSNRFSQTEAIPIVPVRGQVSHVSATPQSSQLKTVLCHKGYFTPAFNGSHCMGATFDKGNDSRAYSTLDDETNLTQLNRFYGDSELCKTAFEITGAKAAIRCTTKDHHALVGALNDTNTLLTNFAPLRKGQQYGFGNDENPHQGLYIFTGLGARGLCSAPLLAELLVCEITGEPLPVPTHISEMTHPNRFVIREIKRKTR